MKQIYFDTEFIEDGHTIELISIGMCMYPFGRELYLVSSEFDESKACPWVRENVLSQIPADAVRHSRANIAACVSDYVLEGYTMGRGKAQIWGYYADYDWVALCQLFGRMLDLPPHFPMYAMDLKQLVTLRHGDRKLPKQQTREHHALNDAKWVRDMCLMLEPPGHNPVLLNKPF